MWRYILKRVLWMIPIVVGVTILIFTIMYNVPGDPAAIILGTEGDGLAQTTIADCDYTVKIPMSHGVDSLNVAAASAVAFWELGRVE